MSNRGSAALCTLFCSVSFCCSTANGQQPRHLTLEEAEQIAVSKHPRLASASLNAKAATVAVQQYKSAFQPLLTGNVTSAGADQGTAIAAGTLQTSGLASRAATGIGFSQLVTDFGRTSNLTASARLRAAAQDQNTTNVRAQILLAVDQAYYSVLAAESVLKTAQARVDMYRLSARQVRALADSGLRSTLDVSFAEVAVSEAELALYQAENALEASNAQLAGAIGETADSRFSVSDVPLPGRLGRDADSFVDEALKNRPDLSSARLSASAAERFAAAEDKLKYPAISIVGVAGVVPVHQSNFPDQYSAAGLNISIPFLNGGLYSSRRAEAALHARSAEKDSDALAVQIAERVRVAWIDAENAWRRIDLTARLVDQTATSLRLAKARYDIGLGGIVELTQAQFALTSAQIAAATAKYDYLSRVANLSYVSGALR